MRSHRPFILFYLPLLFTLALNACSPAQEQSTTPALESAGASVDNSQLIIINSPIPPTLTPTQPDPTNTPAQTPQLTIHNYQLSIINSPTPEPTTRPSHLLLPDAELIYSPTAIDFDIAAYLNETNGFLSTYQQYLMITGWTSAAEIIERVALENSINPRLLIALLEYQSGCILGQPGDPENFDTAMGADSYYRKDLYGQLVWAVHALSEGFYSWRAGTLREISYPDGTLFSPPADINAGSVALYYFFAQLYDQDTYDQAINSQNGFPALYEQMFGDPWERAADIEPIIPDDLAQPELTLPFEPGETWAYTGGPHKAFEGNGPLAALDFAPRMDTSGCVPTNEWVVAMTDGLVVRSQDGVVIQDLDGDGHEQTGWVIMYLHIGEADRVHEGAYLQAGERVGHPSCEGGRATGTHTHIARKYNGVWIAADGPYPFVLDGWRASAGEEPYLGTLTRGEEVVTAHQFGSAVSRITRDNDQE